MNLEILSTIAASQEAREGRSTKRLLIVGSGIAGRELARALSRGRKDTRLVGFVDDRFDGRRTTVDGFPLLGRIEDLGAIAERTRVAQVCIAIPSAEGSVIRRAIVACSDAKVAFRIVPRLLELVEGRVRLNLVRDVRPEDLLGRSIAKADQRVLRPYFRDAVVVVTGAAGSIGSELARQLAEYAPAKLVALDWWENGMYDLEMDFRERRPELNLETAICNIQNADKVSALFDRVRPDFVFHAAAYKHVPLMEKFPEEALRNNVLGTWNIARAAKRARAKKFVLISTDKAVNPTSVMGATKAVAELLIGSLDSPGSTRYSCVRFGNVLASRGSVVPRFQRQIEMGGPVTLTHPEMVRYFMTIPEATQLILQACRMSDGGEVFVLDMGEPVKVLELARSLIRLSGYVPDVEIPIVYSGIRPGEKLYEEVLTAQEGTRATKRARIFIAPRVVAKTNVARIIRDATVLASSGTAAKIRRYLKTVVAGYTPKTEAHDA